MSFSHTLELEFGARVVNKAFSCSKVRLSEGQTQVKSEIHHV